MFIPGLSLSAAEKATWSTGDHETLIYSVAITQEGVSYPQGQIAFTYMDAGVGAAA